MPERAEVVALMLATARRIVAADEFAHDAIHYAMMAADLEDRDSTVALRGVVVARKAEIMVMRAFMAELAAMLARMPIEVD